MSSALIVFLPACIEKSRASLAIFMPISWRAFASSLAAASLTRSAPDFLQILCIAAIAISNSVITSTPVASFLIKAIIDVRRYSVGIFWFGI